MRSLFKFGSGGHKQHVRYLSAMVTTFLSAYAQEQEFSELQYFSAPKFQAQQSYYFAVHPLYNPERQQKAYLGCVRTSL